MFHKNEQPCPAQNLRVLAVCGHSHEWSDSTTSPVIKKYLVSQIKCNVGQCKHSITVLDANPTNAVITDTHALYFIVTSPSQEPESRVERRVVCLAKQFTPSLWPSRAAKKGLASTLSILVALRARVYSLHTSNGWRLGS